VKPPPFQVVLDRHAPEVHRYLVALVGPTDAADCLQETFVAALRAYDGLVEGSNVRGWLFTIAQRKAIDLARARERRAVPVGAVPDGEPPAAGPDGFDGGDDELWQAVSRLPEKQRLAVVHRFVADLPYAEVGRLLGCTDAAARQNVRQALVRLREELA
jgi:DNA-directed RNA polymerase specialized sigma24 family protein